MENEEVQKKCAELLKQFGESGFIVFGWKKKNTQFGVVYATHKMPPNMAVKGMLWAAEDYAKKKL